MDKFIEKAQFTLVYPSILAYGSLINLLVDASRLERQRSSYYLLSSGNIVNKLFAYRGNLTWTILFTLLAVFQVWLHAEQSDLLPRDARSVHRVGGVRLAKQYTVKLILKNVLLYLAFLFIDNLFVWTGGSCSTSSTRSAERCRKEGGSWDNGFDISGHFCFLTNISLILWYELRSIQKKISSDDISPTKTWIVLRWSTLIVLITWSFILSVTAVYYHTLLEKVLGLTMGYLCPTIMYLVIPNHSGLRSLLY